MEELLRCRQCAALAPPAAGYVPERLQHGKVNCEPCDTARSMAHSIFAWIEQEELQAWLQRATPDEIRARIFPGVSGWHEALRAWDYEAKGRLIEEAYRDHAAQVARVQAAYAAGGSSRAYLPHPRVQASPPWEMTSPCVYVVQLLERRHCFKIGQTQALRGRLSGLRADHGKVACVLLIPHATPRQLEKALHAEFAAYRIYEQAGASELFEFKTKPAQKVFARLLQRYSTCILQAPQWSTPAEVPPLVEESQQRLL